MFLTPKQAVKAERDKIFTELQNAKAYLQKAIEEKQKCQARVDEMKLVLDLFDAWLLANI